MKQVATFKLENLMPTPDPRAFEEMRIFDSMPPEWKQLVFDFGLTSDEYKTVMSMRMTVAQVRSELERMKRGQ